MKRYTKIAIDFLYYIVGSFIYSFAITAFISANEISPGGFTGIATLVNFVANIPTGIVLLALNIPVIILGFVKLGGAFILKTAGASVIVSVCLDISEKIFPRFDTDSILAAVFGG
ncbi:MAG: YitT family protein, partial [Clostridia bacterium]|nr:YitT family protein [Clostridia bacterium]